MRRIDDLSTPVVKEMPEVRDIGQVPESALTYQITRRIQEIAYPKRREGITSHKMAGEVSPAALRAIGTQILRFSFFPSQPTVSSANLPLGAVARITPGLLIKLEGVNTKNGQVENSVVRERMGVARVVGRTGTGNFSRDLKRSCFAKRFNSSSISSQHGLANRETAKSN